MPVITEADVRRLFSNGEYKGKKEFVIPHHQIITPSARAYLTENNITIKVLDEGTTPVEIKVVASDDKSVSPNKPKYQTLFGATINEKPEHMTHLRGNMLVFKDHPIIAFRGAIDSLESEIILAQIACEKQNRQKVVGDLEEIISFIRGLTRCEITGEPVGEFTLQGLTAADLREYSHHPSKYFGIKHFLPTYTKGELFAILNKLRTLTREVELKAYRAFKDDYGKATREDIVKALNRLSSLFWIMSFKYLAKQYD